MNRNNGDTNICHNITLYVHLFPIKYSFAHDVFEEYLFTMPFRFHVNGSINDLQKFYSAYSNDTVNRKFNAGE